VKREHRSHLACPEWGAGRGVGSERAVAPGVALFQVKYTNRCSTRPFGGEVGRRDV
jgi:hypothetical protein